MVPKDQGEIAAAACQAVLRLIDKIRDDRESLVQSRHHDAAAGLECLNALARQADELRKAFDADSEKIDPKP